MRQRCHNWVPVLPQLLLKTAALTKTRPIAASYSVSSKGNSPQPNEIEDQSHEKEHTLHQRCHRNSRQRRDSDAMDPRRTPGSFHRKAQRLRPRPQICINISFANDGRAEHSARLKQTKIQLIRPVPFSQALEMWRARQENPTQLGAFDQLSRFPTIIVSKF